MTKYRWNPTRRRFVLATSATAAAGIFGIGRSASADPEFVLKIATVAPPGTPWAKQLKAVKKRIQTESEGRIKVKTYLGGSKGDEISTAEACKRGAIAVFGGSTGALASPVPEMAVFELPYLFPDVRRADDILDNVIRDDLEALLWDRGYKLGFWAENGYRSIGSTFPISSPSDLVGKKMRSQEADTHIMTWKAWKASPVPMAVTEVLSGLQTGVVEGFDNTPLFAFAASWYQGISHFTLTKHIYQPGVIVTSRKFWESLPKDLQEVVQGDPVAESKKGRRGVRKIGKLLLANFDNAGKTVNKLSSSDREAFAKLARPVHDKWAKKTTKAGRKLLKKIRAAL